MSNISIAFAVACMVAATSCGAVSGGASVIGAEGPGAAAVERTSSVVIQSPGFGVRDLEVGKRIAAASARSSSSVGGRVGRPEVSGQVDESEGSGGMVLAGVAIVLLLVSKRHSA